MHHLMMHLHPSPAAGVVVVLSLAAVAAVAGRAAGRLRTPDPGGMALLCQCDPASAATSGEVAA